MLCASFIIFSCVVQLLDNLCLEKCFHRFGSLLLRLSLMSKCDVPLSESQTCQGLCECPILSSCRLLMHQPLSQLLHSRRSSLSRATLEQVFLPSTFCFSQNSSRITSRCLCRFSLRRHFTTLSFPTPLHPPLPLSLSLAWHSLPLHFLTLDAVCIKLLNTYPQSAAFCLESNALVLHPPSCSRLAERASILPSIPALLLPRQEGSHGTTEYCGVVSICSHSQHRKELLGWLCFCNSFRSDLHVSLSDQSLNPSLIELSFVNLLLGPRIMNLQLRLGLSSLPSLSLSSPESHLMEATPFRPSSFSIKFTATEVL